MSERLTQQQLQSLAMVTEAPNIATTQVDRSFGLPAVIFRATAGLYLAFVGVMAVTFFDADLALPMAIIAGFLLLGFGLVGLWATLQPDNAAPTWGRFAARGFETLSGRLTMREAAVQILMLPVLILSWALVIAIIVALT